MDAWFLYSKEAMHPNFFILFFLFPTLLFLPCYSYLVIPTVLLHFILKTIDINFDHNDIKLAYYNNMMPKLVLNM